MSLKLSQEQIHIHADLHYIYEVTDLRGSYMYKEAGVKILGGASP